MAAADGRRRAENSAGQIASLPGGGTGGMGSRVPVQHYTLRSTDSYIGGSLHDLNAGEGHSGEVEGISDVDQDAVTDDGLDNDDDSNSADCLHGSYRAPLQIHGVRVDDDGTSLENTNTSRSPYDIISPGDVLPIETVRARFLQMFVDHFIHERVREIPDSFDANYTNQPIQEKVTKQKMEEVEYEGDPNFALPLMYVANLYETLVNEVNVRLSSLDGIRDKNIGVALEAAGGLYRKLAKKFPRKGQCAFRRRELATSLETRTRFPELVVQEEKRVRFVVVNGLEIVEKPTSMTREDSDWFKRLTGRHEVAISAREYKFYSPRHKYRRLPSHPLSNISVLPAFSNVNSHSELANVAGFRTDNEQQPPSKHHMQGIGHQPQFHPLHQTDSLSLHQNQHFQNAHQCAHSSHLPDIHHPHQSPPMSQHMTCLQSLSGGHVGGRLTVMSTNLAKFCDECGSPYLRETSKYCSECGVKRLGI